MAKAKAKSRAKRATTKSLGVDNLKFAMNAAILAVLIAVLMTMVVKIGEMQRLAGRAYEMEYQAP